MKIKKFLLLPIVIFQWLALNGTKNNYPISDRDHLSLLSRHEMENYKQNQVKIIKLYHIGIYNNQSQNFLGLTIYLNGKNYDSQKKEKEKKREGNTSSEYRWNFSFQVAPESAEEESSRLSCDCRFRLHPG